MDFNDIFCKDNSNRKDAKAKCMVYNFRVVRFLSSLSGLRFKSAYAIAAIFIFLAIVWSLCDGSANAPVIIRVDPAKKFQKIVGWEATAQAGQSFSAIFPLYSQELFREAVNDLGINRLRVEIKTAAGDDGNVADPGIPSAFDFTGLDRTIESVVFPMRSLLQKRKEKILINLCYVDFRIGQINFRNNPDQYAEFVLTIYQHLTTKYQLTPYSWEIILEADNASWSPDQLSAAVVAIGNRLRSGGFQPRLIVPSTASLAHASTFFDAIIRNPDALKFISELSYHRYRDVSQNGLQLIAARVQKFKIRSAMLEHIGSGYTDLHADLKFGQCSAWQQFTLAFPTTNDNGGHYFGIDARNPNAPTIVMGFRTKFLRQYFNFIRNGARRIEATSNNRSFDPLAFINKKRRFVVVVKADSSGPFSVQNLPPGLYGINYTTSDRYNVSLADVRLAAGDPLHTSIPARGVITIYRK